MGLFDFITNRNKELEFMFDLELIGDVSSRIHMKKLAIQTCTDMIGRTISQTEFFIRKDDKKLIDDWYYKMNVKPNMNMNASMFWQTVIHKLIHDNECLIIQSDSEDLLIADSFVRNPYPLVGDTFNEVVVRGYNYNRTFAMADVIYLEYSNSKLAKLFDSLYTDYGELFGRIVSFQKRKNQIRGIVDIDATLLKDTDKQAALQNYINKVYSAYSEKDIAYVPQQKAFKLEELKGSTQTHGVDEVMKVSNGYLDQVAMALGIPRPLVHGDMADVDKVTKNYLSFCIDPFLKKIRDELTAKSLEKSRFFAGDRVETNRVAYRDIFDVATAVDKLRSSGVANGHELRDRVGLPRSKDPLHDKYVITKNYQESNEALKGGEKDEA
ncbi:phage portal protein [Sutcliffiella horikoshii]|uniref:phage portal protein n=1 Tax=Sutcliffiella horikoshii TaxID=79883 RepID=UPI003CF3E2E3